MLQTRTFQRAGTSDQAMHLIALLQQQFGQVRTILSGDTGDEGGFGMLGFGTQDFRFQKAEAYSGLSISCCNLPASGGE